MVKLTTLECEYELRCDLRSGRIEPQAGEKLSSANGTVLLYRGSGSSHVRYAISEANVDGKVVVLRDANKLALMRYLDQFPQLAVDDGVLMEQASAFAEFEEDASRGSPARPTSAEERDALVKAAVRSYRAVQELDHILGSIRSYGSRGFRSEELQARGSEISASVKLAEDGRNLWSVLRNLHDRRSLDDRYDTILKFMREAFPGVREFVFEATGPNVVYCEMIDARRNAPVAASGWSDGHLHALHLFTALFAGEPREPLLLLFDEPETSLHPWPLAVLARAISQVCEQRRYQVIIATHSPVLLSQFRPKDILAASLVDGRTLLQPVEDIEGIADLLDQYAVGSLYMAEAIAPQSVRSDDG